MSSNIIARELSTDDLPPTQQWRRRLFIVLTVLAILAIVSVVMYALSLIIDAVVLVGISALLAYLIYPLVRFAQRSMIRPLAILVVYLLLAVALTGGMFIITSALVQQTATLAQSVQLLLSPAGAHQIQSVMNFLEAFGVTSDQINQFKQQVLSQTLGTLSGLLPLLLGVFTNLINLIVIITLSVYFVLDGPRILRWCTHKTPARQRNAIAFLLHALDLSLGGYFRGTLLVALTGALCTGVGLWLLHVPYAAMLGVLFFFLYFVPVIGAYLIGALCILAAWPQGWILLLIVAVYITLLQSIFLGQILSPRVFSKTLGIHPIVAVFALFAGGELFGLLGGFLAIPVAGVLQQIMVALWHRWEKADPAQFPPEEAAQP